MSHPVEVQPPKNISQNVRSAIVGALKEEKTPLYQRILKAFLFATLLALILLLPIKFLFQDSLDSAWIYSGIVWWIFMFVGFCLYYTPHPRLTLPGYFSPSVFAKVMIIMSVANALQILICPDLVFLDSPIGWSPFRGVTLWLMDIGGMQACMSFCGFAFSFLSSFIGFAFIFKTLKRGQLGEYSLSAILALVSQLPLLLAQLNQASLREFIVFWISGVLLGVSSGLLFWRGLRNAF